ncbi:hypothetical protein HZA56_03220 [Candidatus Poribacteria bacterium]|nr:hypothetical protein [Candidatus Poribacteria bacterium]
MGSKLWRIGSATGLVFLLAFFVKQKAAAAADFRPYGSVRLEYEVEKEKTGDETVDRTTFTQEYKLQFDGYIWRRDFVTFQTYFSYDDSMEDDSDKGESRDRDINLYEITANVMPEWPTPLTLYTKKHLILLDSEQSANTETVEDTYRINWRILHEKLPEMQFEFERILETTEDTDAGVETTDARHDNFLFNATRTFAGRTSLKFEYQDERDSNAIDDTEDIRQTYVLSGTSEPVSNLRIEARAEFIDETKESASVVTSLAVREDVDAITQVTFFDATANNIGDHIAVPLTALGDPDFSDWVLSTFSSNVELVNNNEIKFVVAPRDDVVVVIEYETQDGQQYFDIYLGDGTTQTFALTVTKVIVSTVTDDFMVFADYFNISGGQVTLDFSGVTQPEPIATGPFPIQDVDVTIAYNTRSGNHFEDEFLNVDIQQTGTTFDLTRISPGEGQSILAEMEITYLPIPSVEQKLRYEFDGTSESDKDTTDHLIKSTTKCILAKGLINTTELSYEQDVTNFERLPDVVGDPADLVDRTEMVEWNFSNEVEYTRLLSWATLEVDHTLDLETREEKATRQTDTINNALDLSLLMGRTKLTNKIEYDVENTDEQTQTPDSKKRQFTYDLKAENRQAFRGAALDTTLEYKFELDRNSGEDDNTRHNYLFEEEVKYKAISFETSLEYEDESQGDKFTKELESDSELRYKPLRWLELKSGLDWINTRTEQDNGSETTYFLEGDVNYALGRAARFELGARQEWVKDELGENEDTLELDARVSYIYAKAKATLEIDYDRTDFEETDDKEDLSVKLTVERSF